MDATRTQLWTAGWSRRRRVAVAAFGLFMLYVQSLYFTGFYIPEEEYWFPFWTGMTVSDRMLSLALASWCNVGLIVAPFLRKCGRALRLLLVASLACGAIVSFAWIGQDLLDWINTAIKAPNRFPTTFWALADYTAAFYSIYGIHAYLCIRFARHVAPMRADSNR